MIHQHDGQLISKLSSLGDLEADFVCEALLLGGLYRPSTILCHDKEEKQR